ncbi:hypothetical protein [Melaminivora alkalimesophila]|uniref:hypothetical protein n=1 Tax=Melaminivora alkalimesophila TaxID=1165852 RepID=UPI001146E62B|nr:hypothetical protein [Melaminivora alkalimesophila]
MTDTMKMPNTPLLDNRETGSPKCMKKSRATEQIRTASRFMLSHNLNCPMKSLIIQPRRSSDQPQIISKAMVAICE